MIARIAPGLAVLAALLLAGAGAAARTLEVGAGKPFPQPSAAASAALDGDHVLIEPGTYTDCAVWRASDLVIEGRGDPAATVITGPVCEGKALFVTAGNRITVRRLTLTHARAPSDNGAGIRAEGVGLVVEQVRFIDDQDGILAGANPAASIVVRQSEFVGNGTCTAECAHGIYAGKIGLLRVERSRFRQTREGHHIKSRALRTEIVDNDIADGPDGTASYLIDIPNGSVLLITGNTLEKGPRAENQRTMIMLGAEGATQSSAGSVITDNTARNDGGYRTDFVLNETGTPIVLGENRLIGAIDPLQEAVKGAR